jgi:hypothetical protein
MHHLALVRAYLKKSETLTMLAGIVSIPAIQVHKRDPDEQGVGREFRTRAAEARAERLRAEKS